MPAENDFVIVNASPEEDTAVDSPSAESITMAKKGKKKKKWPGMNYEVDVPTDHVCKCECFVEKETLWGGEERGVFMPRG